MYWYLLFSTSDIKHYDNLYLSFYHRWKSSSKLKKILFIIQVLNSHYINPSLFNFDRKSDREIIWNFALYGYYTIPLLIMYFKLFERQCRLSKYYSMHIKGQSWHWRMITLMVVIIGIQNYAFHEPIPGHQLNILWQNAVSDLYIFHHQRVNISLWSMLECLTRQSKVDNSEIWSFLKCGFLLYFTICKHGDHIQTVQTEKRRY